LRILWLVRANSNRVMHMIAPASTCGFYSRQVLSRITQKTLRGMKTLNLFQGMLGKVLDWLERPLMGLACILLALTIAVAFEEVISRYIFSKSSAILFAINPWMLVWFAYLTMGLVLRKHGHITIDILVNKLSRRVRAIMTGINLMIVMCVSGALAYASVVQVHTLFISNFVSPGLLQAPMWAVQLIMPISLFLLCFCSLEQMLKVFNTEISSPAAEDK